MTRTFHRRAVLGLLAGGAAGAAFAQPRATPRPRPRPGGAGVLADAGPRPAPRPAIPTADELIARANLSGRVGFAAVDMETGTMLESRDPMRGMPPASSMKALTAAYAADRLGLDHRFETRLVATGPVEGGVLRGDLILAGGGDPVLGTGGLRALAEDLRAAGVTEVEGAFRVFDGALPVVGPVDPDQPEHLGYNPTVSGLMLNFGRVHFSWERTGGGYDVQMDARGGGAVPEVASSRMEVVDRAGPVYTYRDVDGIDAWTVARGQLGGGGSRWLPVRNPARYAGDVFRTLAGDAGIELPRAGVAVEAPVGAALATLRSPPLREIASDMLRYSTNATAEVLGLNATLAGGRAVSSLLASGGSMAAWAGPTLGMRRLAAWDHSGLNVESDVRAGEMAEAMRRMPEEVAALLYPFPLRGPGGGRYEVQPVDVRAKTGTLNFVSALAGRAMPPRGRPIAFAIFVADEERRAAAAARGEERPAGSRTYVARARVLQSQLIERWAKVYG
ncbi:D-alanyl-D-alanine carboxypeptidase/D-alanyl-D-alanine-endopeptidase (penicillin-binding protein 4) [Hasllibacter halocynthiae]|uniref:D-alanyl-D-alanine carboxypeptidase/D-alanyl-D-alanine-endopeptidase (Penicillin-binding protein 4) n=1 Tax=Hasllibacter halocynthiae TaxID=595589 RepID=A0A2T0X493_9RHOB|nr:D-alanyl-D-alanine carboxypeptidase/D-alanyl-D-alanine-endopeptidase [Hasllibacter halocynthiae]PRY93760.1 D-alanyl-D-alanine carboxypeptidase/D-alanyl-D-alanine-endopeptidase (penicillin-binding protein 4) [Hasllibacter halocynthiae]